jgi:hypothetical protein
MMLKVLDATLDYKKDVRELLQRFLDQLRRSKRSILSHFIQWTSITTVCFLLVYSTGTLALYTITPYRSKPAHSDLQTDYGEWVVVFVPRVDPDIVQEIKMDNPQNPEVFKNPEEMDPYEDPFIIIQGQPGNEQPPILDTPQPPRDALEPTNTRSPDRAPTSTPIVTESPTPTPTLILTVTPTNTPAPTQAPTNTPVPPTPTSPPPPTDQSLVTICHKPGEPNEITLQVPQASVANHLTHGDYIGGCAIP